MHFVSTVLPAPLSPTSAITWPRGARRSAPVSALTAPKCFKTPFASSRFSSLTVLHPHSPFPGMGSGGALEAPRRTLHLLDAVLRAVLRVHAGADLGGRQEPVLDHGLVDVRRGDRDRGVQDRGGLLAGAVGDRCIGRGHLA